MSQSSVKLAYCLWGLGAWPLGKSISFNKLFKCAFTDSYLKISIDIITNSISVGDCFIRISDCSIRVFRFDL